MLKIHMRMHLLSVVKLSKHYLYHSRKKSSLNQTQERINDLEHSHHLAEIHHISCGVESIVERICGDRQTDIVKQHIAWVLHYTHHLQHKSLLCSRVPVSIPSPMNSFLQTRDIDLSCWVSLTLCLIYFNAQWCQLFISFLFLYCTNIFPQINYFVHKTPRAIKSTISFSFIFLQAICLQPANSAFTLPFHNECLFILNLICLIYWIKLNKTDNRVTKYTLFKPL